MKCEPQDFFCLTFVDDSLPFRVFDESTDNLIELKVYTLLKYLKLDDEMLISTLI